MTSERRIKANRENAQASTGPKSVPGRIHAARNALSYGLTRPVCSDPCLSEEVERLAHEISGADANAQLRELAHRVAEAQIDVRRVRYARHQLLSRALSDPHYDPRARVSKKLVVTRTHWSATDIPLPHPVDVVTSTLGGTQNFAAILAQESERLLALDRYERRALSRRKCAIQAYDEARRRAVKNCSG